MASVVQSAVANSAVVAAPGLGTWWVLHTRPRAEKRVAEALALRDVEYYLPLIAVHHAYAKSRATFERPLFPGYLFMRGGTSAREAAYRSDRIVGVLPVPDQARFERELHFIRRAVESDLAVALFPGLQRGTRCRIRSGPLSELEGTVLDAARRAKVYLSITALGQSAVLEIDAALLEPLD